ncbi:Wadjet anti-phage system protein JetA family protein [Motiliproteus sp. SC1-56]|uniref:Wadjet anti-phage system protein JetA family protein n=1 Tax=Motiliproteus sp. SC1-56 TaxID=2799565 RepID=UPI001A8E0D25|nr:Wadjet anti-phage system protein JetA family protein [Motiliproteus sp. SC1-56]
MLFNKLPDDLFTPLSGQNRQIYQVVLIELADLFFDEDLIDPFIPKDLVRSTIEEAVIKHGIRSWSPESDDEGEGGETPVPRSSAEYTNRIYRRLVKTGWLDEEQQIYRTYVLMAPSVSYVLRTLIDVATFQKKSYGGAVLNVLSSVEAAIKDPAGRGLTLQEAARTAADFSAHLTDMLLGLRELKQGFAATSNAQDIVRGFFDHFVEAILVSDYKTLKTHNNPFRFRRQLLGLLKELQFDPVRLGQLIDHYQEVLELGNAEAEVLVNKHITRIIRIFESVDERLQAIDDFRFRLEKRVADTVRYMDKTTPGMSARLSRLITQLAKKDDAEMPLPDTLEEYGFLSPRSVRSAPRRRTPPSLKIIQQRIIDPEVLLLRQRFKEYKERRQITGAKLEAFIERQLDGQDALHAQQFSINTIEDYIAFSYLRHMPSLGKKAKAVAAKYELRFEDRYVNVADMVKCRAFTLERKKGQANAPSPTEH